MRVSDVMAEPATPLLGEPVTTASVLSLSPHGLNHSLFMVSAGTAASLAMVRRMAAVAGETNANQSSSADVASV
jgi:hypothetical protein